VPWLGRCDGRFLWFITESADKLTTQVFEAVSVVDMKLRVVTPEDAVGNH